MASWRPGGTPADSAAVGVPAWDGVDMSHESLPEINRPSNAARVLSVTGAGVAGLLSTALLVTGGVALWGDGQKDAQGYLSTSSEQFTTSTRALHTDNLDLDTGAPSWLLDQGELGKVRLKVSSTDGKPVFVGIAPTREVAGYLDGTAHATITDVDTSPFSADYQRHAGARVPAAPATQRIWSASAQGTGTQRLDWRVKDGDWSVVVMNADASPGVHADVSAGAKVPFLDDVAWAALGMGLVLMLAAGGLLYLGVRAPGSRPPRIGATPVAA